MKKNKRIVIIGAGGHGRVCAEIAELCGYEEIAFLDDSASGTINLVGRSNDFVFFINNCDIKDGEIEGGILERIAYESVMITNFIDKWNKTGNKNPLYINENATDEQFKKLNENISRLENIVTEDTKALFNSRDLFIWFALFDKFTYLGFEDSRFKKFLNAFVNGLRDKEVDGKQFDRVDDTGSTKDKANIVAKLHILETLMNEYLHIEEVKSDEIEQSSVLDFIRENVNPDTTEEDVELYSDMLDDLTLEVDNDTKLLDEHNRPSLLALVGYACENDIDLDEWIKQWFVANTMYVLNQKRNFEIMRDSIKKGAIA